MRTERPRAASAKSVIDSRSRTIRTARVRTSGENLFVVLLVMATFSRVGAFGNPGAVHRARCGVIKPGPRHVTESRLSAIG